MATIKPCPSFNAVKDATDLRAAMKGAGTDEASIIKILTKRTLKERLEIQNRYALQFGRELLADLKSELGGKFEKLILSLLDAVPDLLARDLNKAIVGFGTDESELKDIICTLTPAEINDVRISYEKLFGVALESAVAGDISGHYKALLVALLTVKRNATFDHQAASDAAKKLFNAGENRIGSDEKAFIEILSQTSHKQLKLVFDEYERISGKPFIQAVEEEMSGDLKKGIKTFVKSVTNMPKIFAEQMRTAMKGVGTNDSILIRIIVWRSEIDLGQIKSEYAEHFGEGLATSIQEETSGDYESALISMIEGNY